MSIDLDDIERRINDGIYGGDRMSDTQRDDAFSALAVLLAEVERLRAETSKLRDTLGWVEAQCPSKCAGVCFDALSGEHVGWSKDDTSRKAILDRKSYRP